ncbi:MAG: NAD(P)-dependent oxidoreductase, partial [Vicinamibacterales bacterium]
MPSILVTRRIPSSVLATLRACGDVEVVDNPSGMASEELRTRLAGKDAVVCMLTDTMDRAAIDAGDRLKVIANVAVGYNNIDVAYARSRGIVVTNTPDVLTEAVADFTWALILDITRRVTEGDRLIRRHAWKGWAFDFMLGAGLRGKQLGLVGAGRIARAVAERGGAFGVRTAYYSRRDAEFPGAESMTLDRLLNTSDIVSLHVPLTPETRHLIDRKALARM